MSHQMILNFPITAHLSSYYVRCNDADKNIDVDIINRIIFLFIADV